MCTRMHVGGFLSSSTTLSFSFPHEVTLQPNGGLMWVNPLLLSPLNYLQYRSVSSSSSSHGITEVELGG